MKRNKEEAGQVEPWLISSSGVLAHKTVAQPIKRAGLLWWDQCIGGGGSTHIVLQDISVSVEEH
jgi:hypothetical protein